MEVKFIVLVVIKLFFFGWIFVVVFFILDFVCLEVKVVIVVF